MKNIQNTFTDYSDLVVIREFDRLLKKTNMKHEVLESKEISVKGAGFYFKSNNIKEINAYLKAVDHAIKLVNSFSHY